LTPLLYDFDIEIIEAHHNMKKDSPSGTAMTAFEIIANELGRDPEEVGVYGRKGIVGERTKEEIGLHAIRGGDIVGDHSVMFIGDGERIEINHRAHTREVFIAGVIRALNFIESGEPGKISNMNDVLGID
jgi:4-hydroxy-tetrahydrodipicolinate reductase